jgi:hypothetical protein
MFAADVMQLLKAVALKSSGGLQMHASDFLLKGGK